MTSTALPPGKLYVSSHNAPQNRGHGYCTLGARLAQGNDPLPAAFALPSDLREISHAGEWFRIEPR
jgi:hypothetical protein